VLFFISLVSYPIFCNKKILMSKDMSIHVSKKPAVRPAGRLHPSISCLWSNTGLHLKTFFIYFSITDYAYRMPMSRIYQDLCSRPGMISSNSPGSADVNSMYTYVGGRSKPGVPAFSKSQTVASIVHCTYVGSPASGYPIYFMWTRI